MDAKTFEKQLRAFREDIGTLRGARKAIAASPAGVASIDEAIVAHEAAAVKLVEKLAKENWWNDPIGVARLIPEAAALVGVTDNDSVVKLAQHVARMCRPGAPFDEAA